MTQRRDVGTRLGTGDVVTTPDGHGSDGHGVVAAVLADKFDEE